MKKIRSVVLGFDKELLTATRWPEVVSNHPSELLYRLQHCWRGLSHYNQGTKLTICEALL